MAFISQVDLCARVDPKSTHTALNQTPKLNEDQQNQKLTLNNSSKSPTISKENANTSSENKDENFIKSKSEVIDNSKGNAKNSNNEKDEIFAKIDSEITKKAKKTLNNASQEKTKTLSKLESKIIDNMKEYANAHSDRQDESLSKLELKPTDHTKENNENSNEKKNDTPPRSKIDFIDAAPEIQKIVNRGIIRIGMCTIDQPPFHVKGRNGEFVGFDIELAHDIAAALGVEIEIAEGADWDKLVELMLQDKIDLILSNLSLTETRASKILCSIPYAKIRQCILLNRVLLARASSRGLITLRQVFSDFDQRNFLIQEGTAYASSATNMFPKAQITTTQSWDEILEKLLSRQVVATISDEIEIKKRLRSVQAMELMPVILKGKYDLMVIGVSRNAPQLLHFINSYIECNNVECNVEDF